MYVSAYLNQASRALGTVGIVPGRMLASVLVVEIVLRIVVATVLSSASRLKLGSQAWLSRRRNGRVLVVVDGTDRVLHASFAGKARTAEKH